MELLVKRLGPQDCWRDIVRIKERYRIDCDGKHIKRGRVCQISVGDRSAWVVVHGRKTDDDAIQMDLNLRRTLGVKSGDRRDFVLKQVPWFKAFWLPWKASDPSYRIPGQLALISFVLGTGLGVISLILAVLPLFR